MVAIKHEDINHLSVVNTLNLMRHTNSKTGPSHDPIKVTTFAADLAGERDEEGNEDEERLSYEYSTMMYCTCAMLRRKGYDEEWALFKYQIKLLSIALSKPIYKMLLTKNNEKSRKNKTTTVKKIKKIKKN